MKKSSNTNLQLLHPFLISVHAENPHSTITSRKVAHHTKSLIRQKSLITIIDPSLAISHVLSKEHGIGQLRFLVPPLFSPHSHRPGWIINDPSLASSHVLSKGHGNAQLCFLVPPPLFSLPEAIGQVGD
ncbi:hypothetical protein BDW02DRAFT_342053 [Decorospora gaudefroyi]|uniref:Uncharacterized protein n=1 Tax=Decorospora gaudefroyi TaxID=184978 RepID=A0A6A5KG25_9PLEO|nr:hypothetical protein BDW02DRAFT_342053 [Decorospora gaudefroyi]